MPAAPQQPVVFLKRRYASAIRAGDDQTATRLRTELDRLINGSADAAGNATLELPELPPAA